MNKSSLENWHRFTAADLEAVTQGSVDRKTVENWHNRDLWLTTSHIQPRGKPRLYSAANLFEALTRASLVQGGFTHRAALRAMQLRVDNCETESDAAQDKEVALKTPPKIANFDEDILNLPEVKQRNTKANWYWAIYFTSSKGMSEPMRTEAFKKKTSVADVLTTKHRIASVLYISAIVHDVFLYVERREAHG